MKTNGHVMKVTASSHWGGLTMAALMFAHGVFAANTPVQSRTVKRLFAKPPCEYSTAPLWVWNDMLTEEEVVSTLRDLASQQVKQAFVHPRPGLMTPYLGEDWFRLWKVALKEAGRLDMNLWIYDENSYPSGFAGGWVPELMPESRGRGLALSETKAAPTWTNTMLAVFKLSDTGTETVTDQVRQGTQLPTGRYLAASIVRAQPRPWHGGRTYVDLLYPGVTEKFLEVTLEAYRKELGRYFGKRLPGSFTDEPEIRPAGGLPWTDDLPTAFQKRWGYSLLDNLPSLFTSVGDWKKVRHNYFQLLHELFSERWGKPYFTYCETNHLEFTGHYWEHEWPKTVSVPDNMGMYQWHQRPAIDILMNQYKEGDPHAQFGNVRAVKELGSVGNQFGRRTLCEAYGAGGWDLRFEDMKRIGDWLYVLGVKTMDQHLSYITLRGARKRDHPQSFSYHEPWWNDYHVSAAYFERLAVAMSQGEQRNEILILEPTTTAWMYNGVASAKAQVSSAKGGKPDMGANLDFIGNSFHWLLERLEAAQVEYDLGSEDILARHGAVTGKTLVVGQRAYHTLVLPAYTETLNAKTVQLLEEFLKAGGRVICASESLSRLEGVEATRVTALLAHPNCRRVAADKEEDVLAALSPASLESFTILPNVKDHGRLFHQRRHLADGELLFLVNTSLEESQGGEVLSQSGGVEQWDLDTGKNQPYPFTSESGKVRSAFKLPPAGSLLLFLSHKPMKPWSTPTLTETEITGTAPEIRRIGPNVLTLDYVDAKAGGGAITQAYFFRAQQMVFQKNGLDRNPWDSAVQFKDELITKKFPPTSGFEASYRFVIADRVPANLQIVIERPDLYQVTCNGKALQASPGAWWLDKAFGRLDLRAAARVGENVVTITATPMTMYHELEPAYLLGDFTLAATDKGFVVQPETTLQLGHWNTQGHPFYSEGVTYRQRFTLGRPEGEYRVTLPKWYGAIARVTVNGKPAGHIASQPWQCDVTRFLKAGENTIEVTVVGTLKNTLGPHHNNPSLGTAWPAMFQKGPQTGPPPGQEYHTVGYGLFESFRLVNLR